MKLLQIPGNIGALSSWLRTFGLVEEVSEDELSLLSEGSVLVLPGGNVGGLDLLLAREVRKAFDRGCRLFTICGSFQSLFGESEEEKSLSCLKIFSGRTIRLDYPRIGRFDIESNWFSGNPYYNHSYAVSFDGGELLEGSFVLDNVTGFCQAVRTERVLGVQFHPELSRGIFDEAFSEWLNVK